MAFDRGPRFTVKLIGRCCANMSVHLYGVKSADRPTKGETLTGTCPFCTETIPLKVIRIEPGPPRRRGIREEVSS